jgi:DNA-binding HxlR family transcriptional regulator
MPHIPPQKRHPYDQWSPDSRALDLVGDKWTLLIVRDLSAGPRRFVELQRVLPGISTEQLRSRLNRMVADGMLTRKRYREVPPRVDYALTEQAYDLMSVLGELARWGYEWAWSPPTETESVDLAAIFRLAPGLVRAEELAGTVELTVEGNGGCCCAITLAPDETTVHECGSSRQTDAWITGNRDAWIAALCPSRDRRDLDITGNTRLAETLLDGLCRGGAGNGSADEDRAAA